LKIAVLFSGGKDSVRAVHWCLQKKYKVKYLVTIISENPDSYMFHTCNIDKIELVAEALGIPIIIKKSSGKKEEELKDLEEVLKLLDIDTVVAGGIASNYQKSRIENLCKKLKLNCIFPFWNIDNEKFIRDTIDLNFDVRIVGVFSDGLDKSWLGRKIDYNTLKELKELNKKYGLSLVGEGGEFETIVLNGPIFKKRIKIIQAKRIWDSITNSGRYIIEKAILI